VAVEGCPRVSFSCQLVIATANIPKLPDLHCKVSTYGVTVEGCKHGADRVEVGSGLGKIRWDQFNDCLEFFAGGHDNYRPLLQL
jgi:hypothetical protein